MNAETARQGRSGNTRDLAEQTVAGRLVEVLEEIVVADTPPICDICGQRAWPGDPTRHVFSRHMRAEAA